ncbi:MAG: phospholipase D family protein [Deltaproteobacteria bacterium]|nr:phospholipase D family protein [Deltaproteobacteria bacterium]
MWLQQFRNMAVMITILLMMGGCASLPTDFERTETHAYTDTDNTRIGQASQAEKLAHPGQSGFHLLGNGLDAFVARAALARAADRSIDTQYYMIHNDVVGSLFIDQLLKAAARGVRVRLLVDDIDQGGRDFGTAVLDSYPNIEVRIFNPFGRNTGRTVQYVTGFGKQTRRGHNKSFTVDSQATILGGRNIGDEYFEADPEFAFLDIDVLSVGPVAQSVAASFDLYWNSALSYPISVLVDKLPTPQEIDQRRKEFDDFIAQQADSEYVQHLKNSDLANNIKQSQVDYYWGNGNVIADDPQKLTHATDDTQYHLSKQLKPYLMDIEKELIILSPYFVPGKPGVAFFKTLREKGVRVKILTNSLSSTDVAVVHAGYSKYRKDLLRMGVELYELNKNMNKKERKEIKEGGVGRSKASLHAKSFVFDRERVFIGSFNLDAQSRIQNTEIGVVFESADIANNIAESFDQNINQAAFRLELKTYENGSEKIFWHGLVDGKQKTFDVDPYTGFWKRFGIGFMSILPIESLL